MCSPEFVDSRVIAKQTANGLRGRFDLYARPYGVCDRRPTSWRSFRPVVCDRRRTADLGTRLRGITYAWSIPSRTSTVGTPEGALVDSERKTSSKRLLSLNQGLFKYVRTETFISALKTTAHRVDSTAKVHQHRNPFLPYGEPFVSTCQGYPAKRQVERRNVYSALALRRSTVTLVIVETSIRETFSRPSSWQESGYRIILDTSGTTGAVIAVLGPGILPTTTLCRLTAAVTLLWTVCYSVSARLSR